MKKFLGILLAAIMAFGVFAMSASAYDPTAMLARKALIEVSSTRGGEGPWKVDNLSAAGNMYGYATGANLVVGDILTATLSGIDVSGITVSCFWFASKNPLDYDKIDTVATLLKKCDPDCRESSFEIGPELEDYYIGVVFAWDANNDKKFDAGDTAVAAYGFFSNKVVRQAWFDWVVQYYLPVLKAIEMADLADLEWISYTPVPMAILSPIPYATVNGDDEELQGLLDAARDAYRAVSTSATNDGSWDPAGVPYVFPGINSTCAHYVDKRYWDAPVGKTTKDPSATTKTLELAFKRAVEALIKGYENKTRAQGAVNSAIASAEAMFGLLKAVDLDALTQENRVKVLNRIDWLNEEIRWAKQENRLFDTYTKDVFDRFDFWPTTISPGPSSTDPPVITPYGLGWAIPNADPLAPVDVQIVVGASSWLKATGVTTGSPMYYVADRLVADINLVIDWYASDAEMLRAMLNAGTIAADKALQEALDAANAALANKDAEKQAALDAAAKEAQAAKDALQKQIDDLKKELEKVKTEGKDGIYEWAAGLLGQRGIPAAILTFIVRYIGFGWLWSDLLHLAMVSV